MKVCAVVSSPLKSNIIGLTKEYYSKKFDKVFYLSDEPVDKILKKDITINKDELQEYDVVVLLGADSLKHITGRTGITKYNGVIIDTKYLPILDPNMVFVKPQYANDIAKAFKTLESLVSGKKAIGNEKSYYHFTTPEEAKWYVDYLLSLPKGTPISVDTETTSLSPRKGRIIGFVISTKIDEGVFIDADVVEYYYEEFKQIFENCKCVFHNAKFDIQFIAYEFGFDFPDFEDTMLMHYTLDESVGTHGLKQLALKFTDLGDYELELDTYKKGFCRANKIKLEDFNYGMLPTEILSSYACKDGDATMQLFSKFMPKIESNPEFSKLYNKILKPATLALIYLENTGGPVDKKVLEDLMDDYKIDIEETINEIMMHPAVIEFENTTEKQFNPNSIYHLREIFFNILKLKPVKKTDTGAYSTDAEVLGLLNHPLAEAVLELRKKIKLSQTYLKNIYNGIDTDNRLRSSFNITGTTSGRLSSSGVLNYQNLPRDKDSGIKKVFRARDGYCIVQADLGTAEVYIAAALSDDKFLQRAFVEKLDFHSYIAKNIFKLPCEISEVKKLYPDHRQWAKAITFGINI